MTKSDAALVRKSQHPLGGTRRLLEITQTATPGTWCEVLVLEMGLFCYEKLACLSPSHRLKSLAALERKHCLLQRELGVVRETLEHPQLQRDLLREREEKEDVGLALLKVWSPSS